MRIVVLGAGFAGLWAAIGAARLREEIGNAAAGVEILVIDRNAYHNIRVRNYELDLSDVAIPLPGCLIRSVSSTWSRTCRPSMPRGVR